MSDKTGSEGIVPGEVVLTDAEHEECQAHIRSLLKSEDGAWYVREESADGFKRGMIAHCLIGRAQRILADSGGDIISSTFHIPTIGEGGIDPEGGAPACTTAAKACAIFALSIHYFDFGCILLQVGRLDDAKVAFAEFLNQWEVDLEDPMKKPWLIQRDVESAVNYSNAWVKATA